MTTVLPAVGLGAFCCGGAILLLASSGWLAVLSTEAADKRVLLPLVGLTTATGWLWYRQRGRCLLPEYRTLPNRIYRDALQMSWLLFLAVILAVYFLVPFWIPNYTGEVVP